MTQLASMTDLKEKLSEQIKVSIFNLLPEEKIAELVENEINAFFEAQTSNFWSVSEGGGYSSRTASIQAKVSPFRLIVWEQLNNHLRSEIDSILKSPEFLSRCVIGDEQVKKDIQNAAMTRQEQIALRMASVMFDRMVGDSLLNSSHETSSALRIAVRNVMEENGHL